MIFSRIKKLISRTPAKVGVAVKKQVIPRESHQLSRRNISENALKVLYRLHKAGFEAYLVGGGVRDVLLGLHPKDFDVATNARPEQIQHVFRNSRVIGRRFRLVHVLFGQDVVEVATFRAPNDDAPQSDSGMVLRDNVYGSVEEDAVRRDFTINALYYNIADFSVVDFVGGLKDLDKKQLRLIGDADTRYREDPVRMLRAARLAAKLDFHLEKKTAEPIAELAALLQHVSHARLWDECGKLFLTGHATASYQQLKKLNLLPVLFPEAAEAIAHSSVAEKLFTTALHNTDARLQQDKGVNPAFLFAVLLWPVVVKRVDALQKHGQVPALAVQQAMSETLDTQHRMTAITKRLAMTMRDMWSMQWRFEQRTPARAERLIALPKFRAAFDLLDLRAQSGENVAELRDWWQSYQDTDVDHRSQLFTQIPREKSTGNRRPRRGKPRRKKATP